MDVNSVSTVSQLNTRTTTQAAQQNQFSSDTFYKLLAAQLQYQDPMESMDNTQMILQMAQFATIEQLNNLNQQFAVFMEMSTIQDGAALVGKEVRIGLEDGTIVGVVNKVGFTSSGTLVEVDGKYYDVWRVIEIGNPGSQTGDVTNKTEADSNQESTDSSDLGNSTDKESSI